ncbi:MAG: prephenate dehydratase [Phycisphaerae bacterium]|nr:prephenate dehydratase [Phycisphaerae bacterium]
MAESEDRLAALRRQIDELDEQLVELLNRRAQVVVEVGALKRTSSISYYAPDREKAVLDRIMALNKGPLPSKVLVAIWREMMSGSLLLEKPLQVGYLGPEGSYSHLAATGKFGVSVDYVPFPDIRSIFIEVSRRHCDLGVVPVENSVGGTVIDTLDAFVELQVKICAETIVPIHHNLLANCPMEQVKIIYSKPEVFAQCRNWLATQMREVQTMPVASSSRAAELAAKQPEAAAIGSALAAELYDLKIVCENIEDNPNNCTRFFVISPESAKRTGRDKTAIMFITADKPGALAGVLEVFRQYGLNLTSITSRPSRKQTWEYYFFVDAEGHQEDTNVSAAIRAAKEHCLQLLVLGSFPRAPEPLI